MIDFSGLNKILDNAVSKAIEEVKRDIDIAEVTPYKTGATQNNAEIKSDFKSDISTGSINYNTEYAEKIYTADNTIFKKTHNSNAKSRWAENIVNSNKTVSILGRCIEEGLK